MSNQFAGCQAFGEAAGTTAGSSTGTALASTYTQIIAATEYDWQGFLCTILQNAASPGEQNITLGIGSSSNEWDLISGLLMHPAGGDIKSTFIQAYLPLHVPAGSRIAGKKSNNTGTIVASLQGVAMGGLPLYGCQFTTTYGATGNTGQSVNAGGSANTKGSYTQITASTSFHHKFLMLCINAAGNTTLSDAQFLIDIGVGGAGSETVLFGDMLCQESANHDTFNPNWFGPFPCDIPAGSRLAVRCQASTTDASDRVFGATLIGFS